MSDEPDSMSAMPWRIAAAALAGYGIFAAGLFAMQRSLIYQSGSDVPDLELVGVPGFEAVELATPDGLTTISWYRAGEPGKPTIMVTHGNAGHIGHRVGKLGYLAEAGFGMFLVGYRGFGGNPGRPTEQGLYTDGRTALEWLARHGVSPDHIVLYGESLGTGVAVKLASESPVAAVVLEAPYTSLAEVAGSHYWYVPFASYLVLDRYDAEAVVDAVDAPILMLHGSRDTIIPVRHAEELHAAANEPKQLWIARDAGHNDLYEHGAAEVVLGFLRDHVNGAATD